MTADQWVRVGAALVPACVAAFFAVSIVRHWRGVRDEQMEQFRDLRAAMRERSYAPTWSAPVLVPHTETPAIDAPEIDRAIEALEQAGCDLAIIEAVKRMERTENV